MLCCRMGLGPYMTRFNGLNYLSHPYLGSNSTSYTDWSREHTPGGGYHHHTTDHCPRRQYTGGHQRSRKSSSKTPDTTLASSSKHSSKRDSSGDSNKKNLRTDKLVNNGNMRLHSQLEESINQAIRLV